MTFANNNILITIEFQVNKSMWPTAVCFLVKSSEHKTRTNACNVYNTQISTAFCPYRMIWAIECDRVVTVLVLFPSLWCGMARFHRNSVPCKCMMQVAASSGNVQVLAMEHCVRDEEICPGHGHKRITWPCNFVLSLLRPVSARCVSFLPHTCCGK